MSRQKWQKIYKNKQQHSIYPWSNLVSIIKHLYKKKNKRLKVLEIGCGYGANIQFLLDCGFEYNGLDYSEKAIRDLKKKFPKIKNNLFNLDFTKEKLPYSKKFDLIIDRGSGTHCTTKDFINFLNIYQNNFKQNITYVAADWFSKKHSDSKKGIKIDNFTNGHFKSGQFKDCGNVHFSTENHIKNQLFKNWKCIFFKENISIYKSNKNYRICTYDFVMKK